MASMQSPLVWGESIRNLGFQVADILPRLLGAIVVLLIGWLIASALGRLVHKLVIWSRIDNLLRSAGADQRLANVGMKATIADIAGTLVKWFVLLLVFSAAADILAWDQVTSFLNTIIAFLPNVAIAVLLIVGGYLLGNFLFTLVTASGREVGGFSAQLMGTVLKWAIVIFASMAALIQIGIAESLIHIAFTGLIAMLAIAGGLAFGLGGQTRAKDLLEEARRAAQSTNRPM